MNIAIWPGLDFPSTTLRIFLGAYFYKKKLYESIAGYLVVSTWWSLFELQIEWRVARVPCVYFYAHEKGVFVHEFYIVSGNCPIR
jgi:hypothetical protein